MKHKLFSSVLLLLMWGSLPANAGQNKGRIPWEFSSASEEEAFFLRRIAEFWKDGESEIVKLQILDFLSLYPNSDVADYALGMLGDLYLQEDRYADALLSYQKVSDPSISGAIALNKLHCYYALERWEDLVREGGELIDLGGSHVEGRGEELDFLMGEALFQKMVGAVDPADKRECAEGAKGHYIRLNGGEYEKRGRVPLAEVYAVLEEYPEAARSYRKLIEEHPEKREEILFQVGTIEAKFLPSDAVSTFAEVEGMGGKFMGEATFNLIALLFQAEEYGRVIEHGERCSAHIPESSSATLHFMLGKSHFAMGQYQSAIEEISLYTASENGPSAQLKNALLVQMMCAHKTDNAKAFEETFAKFDALFPEDGERPKALFLHAVLLRKSGDVDRAEEKLGEIEKRYGEFYNREGYAFEYGLIAYQKGRWEESYRAFKSYVGRFASSPRLDTARKFLLSSALNLYKFSRESGVYEKADFFGDLQSALSHPHLFDKRELRECALLCAKVAYELHAFSEALGYLEGEILSATQEELGAPMLSEAHFLAGLCRAERDCDFTAFSNHVNLAKELLPESYDSAIPHLQLYNAYLSLAGSMEKGEGERCIARGAEHLYAALKCGDKQIQRENLFWLAHHYYEEVEGDFARSPNPKIARPAIAEALKRGCELYESLIYDGGRIAGDDPRIEESIYALAKLMERQDRNGERLQVIEEWIERQVHRAQWDERDRNRAFFELARAYEALGDLQRAVETHDFILSFCRRLSKEIAYASTVKRAELGFQLLADALKCETHAAVLAILNPLKEVQMQRSGDLEPIYLEAALAYAKIRSALCTPEERDARYLFLLSRMQEDFTSRDEESMREYHAHLDRVPEKGAIFNGYMKYIDAEKLRIEAKSCREQAHFESMRALHENALSLYEEIEGDPTTSKDLLKWVEGSSRAIYALDKSALPR